MTNPQLTAHERFEADLAELATGVLDRREEMVLRNHLASCSSCAREFEDLASAAKSLLQLVLELEPPIGFETRVLDRINPSTSDMGAVETVAPSGDDLPFWPGW